MIYIATDFHGNYEIWRQIKEYLQADDKLIYLGDAIDRGGRGFEILMEMLDDSRVIFIKGNHEDLMYNAYFCKDSFSAREWLRNWHRNGGRATQRNMQELEKNEKITFEQKLDYIKRIDELPTYVICPIDETDDVYYLTHAGFTPSEKLQMKPIWDQEWDLIWDRKHIDEEWPQQYKNIYIIHGHTPVQFLNKKGYKVWDEKTGLARYADGHKLCLDLGTPSTGVAALYCLNTQEVAEYFTAKPDFQD